MKKTNQQGFGFVFLLLALVVVGVVAFAAVRVMGNNKTSDATASLTTKANVPAKIKNQADLQKASSALEQTPVDSGVNADQLDSDLNALL